MSIQEPRLTRVQSFTVSGLSERTKNEDEFEPQKAKLPKLWERFYNQDIQQEQNELPIFGVYSNYESDFTNFYTVTAGRKIQNNLILPEYNSITIQTGDYLVFENRGAMPQAIIKTWQAVWQYFSSPVRFRRAYVTDFEIYQNSTECAVYIGVN